MGLGLHPILAGVEKITGSTIATGVAAGGSAKVTVVLSDEYVIIGVPKVSTSTGNAEVEFVNGGVNSFEVKAINLDTANAQDIVIDYEVLVIKKY